MSSWFRLSLDKLTSCPRSNVSGPGLNRVGLSASSVRLSPGFGPGVCLVMAKSSCLLGLE